MANSATDRILAACQRMMTPIARVFLANGISYLEFNEVCKRAFVRTASEEFGVRGRETNTSRVSAMTGLPRKEVKKLKRKPIESDSDSRTSLLSPLADLLHTWATADRFLDKNGHPRELSTVGDDSGSFDSLVRACMGDIPSGAVKAELVRLGAALPVGNNKLAMVRRSLIPPDIDTRLESAILYSLTGLAETIAHNNNPRTGSSQPRFERFVESPLLTEQEIEMISSQLRERLTAISEEVDSLLASSADSDSSTEGRRVGVGIFYTE